MNPPEIYMQNFISNLSEVKVYLSPFLLPDFTQETGLPKTEVLFASFHALS